MKNRDEILFNSMVKEELMDYLPDNQIAPMIYLDRFFEQYEEDRELSEILTDVANFVAEAYLKLLQKCRGDMDFMGIDAEAPEVMYVITNEAAQFGASVLLHEDVLKSVAHMRLLKNKI